MVINKEHPYFVDPMMDQNKESDIWSFWEKEPSLD